MNIIEFGLVFTIFFSLTSIIYSTEKSISHSSITSLYTHLFVGIVFVWVPATVITLLFFNNAFSEAYQAFLLIFGIISTVLFLFLESDLDFDFLLFFSLGFIFMGIPVTLVTGFIPWYLWVAPFFPYIAGLLISLFLGPVFFLVSGYYHPKVHYDVHHYYKFHKEDAWTDGGVRKNQEYTASHITTGQFLIRGLCYACAYFIVLNMFSRQDILIGVFIGYLIFELLKERIM